MTKDAPIALVTQETSRALEVMSQELWRKTKYICAYIYIHICISQKSQYIYLQYSITILLS